MIFTIISFAQTSNNEFATNESLQVAANQPLKMSTDYSSDNSEIRDILRFEGIEYMKLKFEGENLKGKTYKLTVKEIWNGKVKTESTVFDSENMGLEDQFKQIRNNEFKFKVISKLTHKNKLRMTFDFGRFSVTKNYDALDSDEYSLRNLADESNLKIDYDKEFYLLAYILPYEREDGSKSWCEVGTSGKDVENWGKKFGIKHYLLFEMKFK